nr:AzlD domain-containing protein [Burkholderia ubonensis]
MGNGENWLVVGIMSALTVALRALPLLLHRSVLRSSWMTILNRELPLCVMMILVTHSLVGGHSTAPLGAEVVALAVVALSYLRWRNALLSVIVGLGGASAAHVVYPPRDGFIKSADCAAMRKSVCPTKSARWCERTVCSVRCY